MHIPSGTIVVRSVLVVGAISAAVLLAVVADAGVLNHYLELWDRDVINFLNPDWLSSSLAAF
jgi:hypothetical protein